MLLEGKRKSRRPLTSKDAIHFVLRSPWAMGRDSFLAKRNKRDIEYFIARFAKKFGVRIYQQSINSNHIHLLLRITNRALYRAFIKAVSGKIAHHVMGYQSFDLFLESRRQLREKKFVEDLKSNNPKPGDGPKTPESETKKLDANTRKDAKNGFWQQRPFSRIVNWGKDFKTCTAYLRQNVLEALGFIPYSERKNHYAKWLNETLPKLGLLSKK